MEKLRENGKFEGTNNSVDNNLPNIVAMDIHGKNYENGRERRKCREDTENEDRKDDGEYQLHSNSSESNFSEAEEQSLLKLKRALFKHDQINEVPGEISEILFIIIIYSIIKLLRCCYHSQYF